MCDNVIEKEIMCHRVLFTIECRHGFDTFSEIIDGHDDVVMTIDQGRITCHEVSFPLTKGIDCDHRM